MDYHRRVLDDQLDALMAKLPAIAIEGPKAAGKTASATQRARTVHQLDDPERRAVAEADLDRVLAGRPPILLDEWQHLPVLWDRVRRAVDGGAEPGRFLLAGSASPADAGSHSGAGRIVRLRMRPFSLAERGRAEPSVSLSELLRGGRPPLAGSSRLGLGDYTEEILASGFPGLRELSDRALRSQLDGYLDRIVDRDFPELERQVRNPGALRRWMSAYAAATATTASFEKIRAAAEGASEPAPARSTVMPYRDVLERLFVLDPVQGWRPSRSRIAELGMPPKHHLADPALAARLLGATPEILLQGRPAGPPIPREGTLLGALFESLMTLSVRVYAQAAEATVKHLRTHRGAHEIDLIVERDDGRVLAAEVKLGAEPGPGSIKHLEWLRREVGDELLDAIVITTGKEAYRRADGIGVVPAGLLGP